MKKLYLFVLTALLLFGSLSGCTTLFDVSPKAIYSPIELDSKLVPLKLSESTCKISFIGKNDSLKYGALIFYDSIAASSFVRERKTIGAIQSVTAIVSPTASEVMSATIGYDNTKGQYVFVTPFAYKAEDSDGIFSSQKYEKLFTAQGYIQLQISPWKHLIDLPNINAVDNVKLFGQTALSYLKTSTSQFAGYRYDASKNSWITLGVVDNKICISPCTTNSVSTEQITSIKDVYESADKLVAIATSTVKVNRAVGSTNKLSVISINPNMTFDSNTKIDEALINDHAFDSYFTTISTTKKTIQGMYLKYSANVDNSKIFLNFIFPSPPAQFDYNYYNIYVKANSFSYDLSSKVNKLVSLTYNNTSPSNIYPYNVGMTIGGKFIVNRDLSGQRFSLFSPSETQIKQTDLEPIAIDSSLNSYIPNVSYGMVPCISGDTEGYAIVANQNIMRIKIRDNKLVAKSIYSDWFPGGTPKSITQGIHINGIIYVLVNKSEIWTINPNQTTIDFSRPGAFSIVSL